MLILQNRHSETRTLTLVETVDDESDDDLANDDDDDGTARKRKAKKSTATARKAAKVFSRLSSSFEIVSRDRNWCNNHNV